MSKVRIIRTLNALMALVLAAVIFGAYYQQFSKVETPCPLCLLQRVAMVGIALGALMNLRFGIHPRYYAFSLLSACFGASVSLRQIALHVCPGFPVFGYPVMGLGLYTWAFIVFACSILAIIGMLFFYSPQDKPVLPFNFFEKISFIVVFLLIAMNIVTAFLECGIGYCPELPWPQPGPQSGP